MTDPRPYDPTLELEPGRMPWERQPDESDREWALFRAYRDLEPTERTVVAAWRSAYPNAGSALPTYLYGTGLAHRNQWSERVEAYDRHMDDEVRKQLLQQRVTTRLETAKLGAEMRRKAAEAIAETKAVLYHDDGSLRQTLSIRQITKLAETALRLERFALSLEGQKGPQVAIAVHTAPPSDEALIRAAAEVLRARKLQEEIVDGEYTVDQTEKDLAKVIG